MSLVSSHDWHDHIDLIEGEPDCLCKKLGWVGVEDVCGTDRHAELVRRAIADKLIRVAAKEKAESIRRLRKDYESPKEIQALCLLCYASHPIGTYIYENHPIELEDGTTTTFEDWRAEAGRNRVGKSRRRKMYCPRCDFLTDHVAEIS